MSYTLKQKKNYCLGAVNFCDDADMIDIRESMDNPMDPEVTYGELWRDDVHNAFDVLVELQNEGHTIDLGVIMEILHECTRYSVQYQFPVVRAFLKVWCS